MFEVLLENAYKYKADVSLCKVNAIYLNQQSKVSKNSNKDILVTDSKGAKLRLFATGVNQGVWNKIYKNAIIKKHDIHFDKSMCFGEDNFFIYNFFDHINTLVKTNLSLYNHFFHEISLSSSAKTTKKIFLLKSFDEMKKNEDDKDVLRSLKIERFYRTIDIVNSEIIASKGKKL